MQVRLEIERNDLKLNHDAVTRQLKEAQSKASESSGRVAGAEETASALDSQLRSAQTELAELGEVKQELEERASSQESELGDLRAQQVVLGWY